MTRRQSRTRLTRAQKRACPATRADHIWTSLVFALCFPCVRFASWGQKRFEGGRGAAPQSRAPVAAQTWINRRAAPTTEHMALRSAHYQSAFQGKRRASVDVSLPLLHVIRRRSTSL